MQQLILIIHVLVAMAIISLVLLQHGKGSDVGAAFGSGASNTIFGSAGTMPFLVKVTAILAATFFATSILLGYMAASEQKQMRNLDLVPTNVTTQQPVTSFAPQSVPTTQPALQEGTSKK